MVATYYSSPAISISLTGEGLRLRKFKTARQPSKNWLSGQAVLGRLEFGANTLQSVAAFAVQVLAQLSDRPQPTGHQGRRRHPARPQRAAEPDVIDLIPIAWRGLPITASCYLGPTTCFGTAI